MTTVAKLKGLELKAQERTDGETANAELYVYGDVVSEKWFESDVSSADFVATLGGVDADAIDVFINSGGGSVFDGSAIYTALKRHSAAVTVYVDGIAASIASVIAMAGDNIVMAENATMMIHDPWSMVVGNATEMRKQADTLDIVKDSMKAAYKRSNLSEQAIHDAMAEETWYTAEQAVEAGLADIVVEPSKMAASIKVPQGRYHFTPEEFLQSKEGIEMPAPEKETPKVEPTGITQAEVDAQVQAAREEAATAAQAQVVEAEKARRKDITALFSRFPHLNELRQECVEDIECSMDKAKDKLMAAFESAPIQSGGGHIQTVADERSNFKAGAIAGLEMRAGLREMDHSNPYRGFGFQDMARACVAASGQDISRMSRDDIIKGALSLTTDFPVIYENIMHKTLLQAFRTAPDTWSKFCRSGDLSDFRAHNRYRTGTFGKLPVLAEGATIEDTTFDDATKEQISAQEHAYIFRITFRMIVDDDMGAFLDIARGMGRAAKRSVEQDVYTALLSNGKAGPVMGDGANLWSAGTHANVIDAAPISVDHLGAMRALMARQMDPSGNDYLDLRPATLLCPTELGDLARQVINSETDIAIQNSKAANPIRGFVEVVDTPRLTGTDYYLLASPSDNPIMEVGFLKGNTEPEVQMEDGFDTRSVHYRITYDYGVAAMEWRSGVYNGNTAVQTGIQGKDSPRSKAPASGTAARAKK